MSNVEYDIENKFFLSNTLTGHQKIKIHVTDKMTIITDTKYKSKTEISVK